MSVGTNFVTCYTIWIWLNIFATHDVINRYARVVNGKSKFGHWYYPKTAEEHTTAFGLLVIPRVAETTRHVLVVVLLSTLLFGAIAASDSLIFSLTFATSAMVSMLYFAQARTHGLVHNKADLVPVVLLLLAISSSSTTMCGNIRFLMGTVYFSSGIMKLRKTGIRWCQGINLKRMILQFMLELRQEKPNLLQTFLLKFNWLAVLSQIGVLSFELLFIVVVVYNNSMLLFVFGIFGIGFHLITIYMTQIDFIRFWVPGLFSALLPWCSGVRHTTIQQEIDVYVCIAVAGIFLIAHLREHDGTHWPISCFDLYNVYHSEDTKKYRVLNLLYTEGTNRNGIEQERPFDLSICSSSGITRSWGFTSIKMKDPEKLMYLKEFLCHVVREECGKISTTCNSKTQKKEKYLLLVKMCPGIIDGYLYKGKKY